MKKLKVIIVILCLMVGMAKILQPSSEWSRSADPYLGQMPPGKGLEPFAPLFFGSQFYAFHSAIVFSPDGREAYWQGNINSQNPDKGIWMTTSSNGAWSAPQVAPFSICDQRGLDDSPFVTPDGNQLFFTSYRSIEQNQVPSDKCHVWMVEKTGQTWSEPRHIPLELDSSKEDIHWRLSVDRQGNLFFGTWWKEPSGVDDDIYMAKSAGEKFNKPVKLSSAINKQGIYNFSPYISPDGCFLLFNRFPDETFIAFRQKNGQWTEAKNISGIVGTGKDTPVMSSDGKYLFLRGWDKTARLWKLYWMDASFIEELRKDVLNGE